MLRRIWTTWDRFGWLLVGLGFVAVVVLGLVGFDQYGESAGEAPSLATRLYLTLQLFTIESGSLPGDVPVSLEVARWAAPVVAASAAAGTVATLLRRHAWGWSARRYAGHLVVIGLGDRGWEVARRARARGTRVAVVEIDPAGPHVSAARRAGIPVVLGDAADPERLRAAGATRARRVIALVPGTERGAAVAHAFSGLVSEPCVRLPEDLTGFVALDDVETVRELNGLLAGSAGELPLEFFALDERAGPVVVDRWAGLRVDQGAPPPVVVIGDSVAARSVIAAAARQWEAHRRDVLGGDAVLEVRWLLPDEAALSAATTTMTRLVPDLLPADVDGPSRPGTHLSTRVVSRPDAALRESLAGPGEGPGLLVVADGDDAATLATVAAADRVLAGTATTVVALTGSARGLVALLGRHVRVEVFDLAGELCSDETIARGQVEAMARALHDGYLRQLDSTLPLGERKAKPAYCTWEALSDELRRQNFAAARALWSMLRRAGYDVVPLDPARERVEDFPDEVLGDLAREEHGRWFAQRHPGQAAPDWATVDPTHVAQTLDQVRRIPATLSAAGLQVTV